MAQDEDTLQRYRAKRNFQHTPEPQGGGPEGRGEALRFVVQKHAARHLHYDFRLELDGVLKSWAVPKGPSLDPADKRMAVEVEDHPLDYAGFEGVIPPGHYGAGTVIVWDRGTWQPAGSRHDARAALAQGRLKFTLQGDKLTGRWTLVRMNGKTKSGAERQTPWLLIKERDDAARPMAEFDGVDERRGSVGGATAGLPAGAQTAPLPLTMAPQLAVLVDRPPTEGEWLYEMKFDGYRLLARLDGQGGVRLVTRNGHDWTAKLRGLAREVAHAAAELGEAWLDGEIVLHGPGGVPDFQRLQNAFDSARQADLAAIEYFVFDLPHAQGHDLRAVALRERRALLRKALEGAPAPRQPSRGAVCEDKRGHVHYSEDFSAAPAELLHSACALRMEGLIGKRAEAPYTSSRSSSWIKLKCTQRQEFVIGGFTAPQGSRSGFGALLLGVHAPDGRLRYAGKVGTGFDEATLKTLHGHLRALRRERLPFDPAPPDAVLRTQPQGVQPALVAEVSFAQWTRDGLIRHASFHGLRSDKPPRAVTRELSAAPAGSEPAVPARKSARAAPAAKATMRRDAAPPPLPSLPSGLRITHGERVIDASTGVTKRELVDHYLRVAPCMLPHLAGRPLALVRGPQGIGGELFFQKHGEQLRVPGLTLLDPALDPGHPPLMAVASVQALVGAVQMNTVEFHTWNALARDIERPDRLVFDLDPGDGVPWQRVQEAAQLLRALLQELALVSLLKTSGGKGLHLVVPFKPALSWDAAKRLSQRVVQHLARTLPDRFSAKSGPRNRVGKIYVDYLRNGRGATTVAAWSARARPGMGVSVPVGWDELDTLHSGAHWTVRSVAERLTLPDPWREGAAAARRQTLTAAMQALNDEPAQSRLTGSPVHPVSRCLTPPSRWPPSAAAPWPGDPATRVTSWHSRPARLGLAPGSGCARTGARCLRARSRRSGWRSACRSWGRRSQPAA